MVDLTKLRGWFGRDANMEEQRTAYRVAFNSTRSQMYLLPDLAEICGVGRPLPTEPAALARAAGRQDVWLHIQRYLNFTEAEVYAMLQGHPIIVKQPE